ncbi:hypothetical protein [Limoniibacter endophyticus]|uniref:Uncharacterized protein n=1 Tax=Limoniibacter endophyticus TaxID=1565040 RepID=A0A8J3DM73_9HYPH|nr:hypothetical protein [Limoniibacter endophyticus]GHC62718.1 hypothetical protein GCM10010136_03970 [Limoniibacter endophyticus]
MLNGSAARSGSAHRVLQVADITTYFGAGATTTKTKKAAVAVFPVQRGLKALHLSALSAIITGSRGKRRKFNADLSALPGLRDTFTG